MLTVSDTLTGDKRPFEPLNPPEVKMYVCGPTVYDSPHLGHARVAVFFDVVTRYLSLLGYRVRYVSNVTDVEDKIIKRASEEGTDFLEVARRYEREYFAAMASLGVAPPLIVPRATEYVEDMVDFISGLVEKGHAYVSDGDVYFDVSSFPEYGKLSKVSVEDLVAGARVEPGGGKRSPEDFALWKAAKPGEPSWPSPWGPGRPGWHIECSVMINKTLGDQIDIHGGGSDLIFPHHENEIAQSEAYTGKSPYVRYWMHVGLVRVAGEKMAKSLRNYFLVSEAVRRWGAGGVRLWLLSAHYRSPLDFEESALDSAAARFARLRSAVLRAAAYAARRPLPGRLSPRDEAAMARVWELRDDFHRAMLDDFGTPRALASLDGLAGVVAEAVSGRGSPTIAAAAGSELVRLASILGLDLTAAEVGSVSGEAPVELLIKVRTELRKRKMWDLADEIRERLAEIGVKIEDVGEETVWWFEGGGGKKFPERSDPGG